MDFFKIRWKKSGKDKIVIFPEFLVGVSDNLMIRGKSFYALYQDGLWTTDEYKVIQMVDRALNNFYDEHYKEDAYECEIKYMRDFSSGSWESWKKYTSRLPDNYHQLDAKIIFSNTDISKDDYVSRRLPYSLEEGKIDSYEKLMDTLYSPGERAKIEWAIGSIIKGDSRSIQKFLVFYGESGAGKSTVLNIIQWLFEGYYASFEAKALTSSSNGFATEVFRDNPLVAIQHDGDLSKIEDNSKLNSIVSHEEIIINEKYKSSYSMRLNCFLFMSTNRPVKITDAKSGIIRRLIDVSPSGNKLPVQQYNACMKNIKFELGSIANHCLQVYEKMGKAYYNNYIPFNMIYQTDVFFNFVNEYYDEFEEEDGVSLKRAYTLYKQYCSETLVPYQLPMYKFREELKNYFQEFYDRYIKEGQRFRSYYVHFLKEKFLSEDDKIVEISHGLSLMETKSIFDTVYSDCKAQYANEEEKPTYKWGKVRTKLSQIDTTKTHYVLLPKNHIVIDFDLKDKDGNKSRELNLKAASEWPPTYAEYSKSGSGVHLHYIYLGDVDKLKNLYSPGIEVKIFRGNASLRRRLTFCNNLAISEISSGLPLKEGDRMINMEKVKSEQKLRALILGNLQKKYHPGTKPSIDFIDHLLKEAKQSGIYFDVTDLRPKILAFAMNSTNQKEYCVKMVSQMIFKSDDVEEVVSDESRPIVFFDCEVYPNLFIICWKYKGLDKNCVQMINPTPEDVEKLFSFNLIGFNCRRYDNHILYARYLGYDNEDLFRLSQKIVNQSSNCFFSEAYNISYTDVYDFLSKKQSLKKWEIELGIHHMEMEFPWNKPIPEEKWALVAEYCCNDVIATETVFNSRYADFVIRKLLVKLSKLDANSTTNTHAAKIVFGDDRHPQDQFIYPDLSKEFPGYKFENGKSTYRGIEVGEGGLVIAEPGMYGRTPVLDVASMHPSSIEALGLFGPVYTKRFSELKQARIAIKHGDIKALETLLDGQLLEVVEEAKKGEYSLADIAAALKIVINSVYGLTAANFDNPFRDPRNIDNVVAKRGALFMVDLYFAVKEQGYTVAHIKTDSIKIPNADQKILDFVIEFGKKYGYNFEIEDIYEKFCLVNNAVYVAKKENGEWTATGAQFQQPYVFKTLFSHEPIEFEDMCETKSVKTALYLDMTGESLLPDANELPFHDYIFVGKVGSFCPIKPDRGGGILLREKDGKYYAATDTKGYFWKQAEQVKGLHLEDDIDRSYYDAKVRQAYIDLEKFGDIDAFLENDKVPWCTAVIDDENYEVNQCFDCLYFVENENGSYKCKKGMI